MTHKLLLVLDMLQMRGVCKGKRKFVSFMKKIKLYLLVQLNFKTENKMSKGLRTGQSTGLSTNLSTKLSTRLSTRPSNCCVQSRAFGAVSQIHRVANCTLFHLSSFSSFSSCSPTTIPPISPYFSPTSSPIFLQFRHYFSLYTPRLLFLACFSFLGEPACVALLPAKRPRISDSPINVFIHY